MTEINFAELKYPDKFSDLMNQLLDLKFSAISVKPPHDKGRDSYIILEDGSLIIFQYKYSLNASDPNIKKELEKSLITAKENYPDLYKWCPCIPREFSSSELEFLDELSKKYEVIIEQVGASKIKNWITEKDFPLDQYFDSHMHQKTDRKISEIRDILKNRDREINFPIINKVVKNIIELATYGEIYAKKIELPIETKEKIEKNKLSSTFEEILLEHMTKFEQIDEFFESSSITSKEMKLMLLTLKHIYLSSKHKYDNGDDIFTEMLNSVLPSGYIEEEFLTYSCLICYFFVACEVFEK